MDFMGRMCQEIGAGTVLPAGGVAEEERTKVVKRDMSWIYLDDYEIYYPENFMIICGEVISKGVVKIK